MGHATVDNQSGLAFEQLYSLDEDGRPVFVPLVQAGWEITRRGLRFCQPQPPVNLAGELWQPTDPSCGSADPPAQTADVISWRIEPQAAFIKLATDVVLVGHAHAPRYGATQGSVGLEAGYLRKTATVRGDRVWQRSAGTITASKPLPFERIPLRFERAFGGWDRTDPDPSNHIPFPLNPVGVGFHGPEESFREGLRLPNLEDPDHPLTQWGQKVPTACFGFVSGDWEPRRQHAGTYDAAWQKERMPLLPKDFDRRFFNAGSPGLVASGYLRGNETVTITGVSRHPIQFALPGLRPPHLRCELVHAPDQMIQTHLDTVIIDTDNSLLTMLYRGHTPLRESPHEVKTIQVNP